jgi:beta-glucanase (GH16 family)
MFEKLLHPILSIYSFSVVSYLSQAQYTLVWADEFNTTGSVSPNAADWNMENWFAGYSGGENQAYTSRLQNACVENGNLIIEAKREAYTTPGTIKTATGTSARVQTRKKHELLYGRVEVRGKLPAGAGLACNMDACLRRYLWRLPVSGEIEIMEHTYRDQTQGTVHGTLHTASYNWMDNTHITATYPVADFSTAYHVYGLEWTPTTIMYRLTVTFTLLV